MDRKIFEVIFVTSNQLNPDTIFEYPDQKICKKIFITKYPSIFVNTDPNFSLLLNPNGMKFDEYLNINFGKIIKRCEPNFEDLFLVRNDIDKIQLDPEIINNLILSNPILYVYENDQTSHFNKRKFTLGPTIFSYSHLLKANGRIKDVLTVYDETKTTDWSIIKIKKTDLPNETQQYRNIIDCFVFNNELDLLEARLSVLDENVKNFVLVESNKTHSGQRKPLFYNENKERFLKYSHKIKHVIVDNIPDAIIYPPSEIDVSPELHIHWFRENFQRNEILRGLYELNLKSEDVVLISDLDEIPDPKKIDFFVNSIPEGDYIFQLQKWYCWDLNHKYKGLWPGTAAIRWKDLLNTTPQEIRKNRYEKSKLVSDELLGWHCSWFGGIDSIMWKLQSFAHQELRELSREDIEKKITMNLDVHGQEIYSNDDGYDPPVR